MEGVTRRMRWGGDMTRCAIDKKNTDCVLVGKIQCVCVSHHINTVEIKQSLCSIIDQKPDIVLFHGRLAFYKSTNTA